MKEKPCAPFAWDRIGWGLVVLNLLAALNSTFYFLTQLKSGVDGWLAMNSCAPSIFLFALGYLLRSRAVMAVASGLMVRYGTLGLFVFGWEGMNIVPQVGHVLMTLAAAYFVVRMARGKGWSELLVAALVVVTMLYADWQGRWFGKHPEVLDALFKGTLGPETFQ